MSGHSIRKLCIFAVPIQWRIWGGGGGGVLRVQMHPPLAASNVFLRT